MNPNYVNLDLRQEAKELKEAYSCGKCQSFTFQRPVLLTTCRHIFCSRCLIIKGTQKCPKCGRPYKQKYIDHDNKPMQLRLASVRRIIEILETNDYQFRDVPLSEIRDFIRDLHKPMNNSTNITEIQIQVSNCNEIQTISELNEGDLKDPDDFERVRVNKKPFKRNGKGETDLHLACKQKNVEKLRQLLENCIDINCVDWSNWTPLHEAVQAQTLECVQLLLNEGCLVNVPSKNYLTPLHIAAETANEQLYALLIKYGSDTKAKDQFGNLATMTGHEESSNAKTSSILPRLTYHFGMSNDYCKNLSDCGKNVLNAFSIENGMDFLKVSPEQEANTSIGILAAILLAVPIVKSEDEQKFAKCANLSFVQLVPERYKAAFLRSLHNRLHCLPKLFDGWHINFPPKLTTYRVYDNVFTREELQGLVELGGGNVLKRAPSEATVDAHIMQAFHCRNDGILAHCAHFILYDSQSPPLLLYKMKELRHISANWLTDCILHFRISGDTL